MTSPQRIIGRGGRRAPGMTAFDPSSYWRTTNSVYNTRPILPLTSPEPTGMSSWDMTRQTQPIRQTTVTPTNSSNRPAEYLTQFFSSVKLEEMKESEGIFPKTDQLPPLPQDYDFVPRGRDLTFVPPPTLLQLEAQERMRPPVLGGRSHKDKLGSVAQSWDDVPPTGGVSAEDRILGMFEIPPDPPSRSASPFRDETWLGPDEEGRYSGGVGGGRSSVDRQAPLPSWVSSALPPKTVDSRHPPQIPETPWRIPSIPGTQSIETTTQADPVVVAILDDEGMEEPPRYNHRQILRKAKAEALRLARAGTSMDPELRRANDVSTATGGPRGSPHKQEVIAPDDSSPVTTRAGSEQDIEEVVILGDPDTVEVPTDVRHDRLPVVIPPLSPIPNDPMAKAEDNQEAQNTTPSVHGPSYFEEEKLLDSTGPDESDPLIIPEDLTLASPTRFSYGGTPQSRLDMKERLDEFRRQLEVGLAA